MKASPTLASIRAQWATLTPAERVQVWRHVRALGRVWYPLPGPQTRAAESEADVLVYGGAAGGGKSHLVLGLACTEHKRVLILRRERAQCEGLMQELRTLLGSDDGLNRQLGQWTLPAGSQALIEFGGLADPGDESRWFGRPHDLLALDEITEIREEQARLVMGWVRSADAGQRCRVVATCNPPTDVEGRWVYRYLAPWLDPQHPNPAADGELRWFTARGDNPDYEVPDGRPFVWSDHGRGRADDAVPVYEFDPKAWKQEQIIRPRSRTFIAARVSDNPFYVESGYLSVLQAMPGSHRGRLLDGDWQAGVEDPRDQVIPTAWVEMAMARWSPFRGTNKPPPMDCLGVDVARGGKDSTVYARRHGDWFDELVRVKGTDSPDGNVVLADCIRLVRDGAPIAIDVIGVGSSPYDLLVNARQHVYGVNVGKTSGAVPKSGGARYANIRSQVWWQMREALDPYGSRRIALPPDRRLLADLTCAKWKPVGDAIQVQSRDEILRDLGRSPDDASAVLLALMDIPKRATIEEAKRARSGGKLGTALDHDPYRAL